MGALIGSLTNSGSTFLDCLTGVRPSDCSGGSVTVVAQAPPDVMPIFVSLPSRLSDTQQSAPTAPPPAVTEASAAVRPFEPGNSRQGNKQMICLIEAAKDKGIPIALDVIGAIPAVGNAVAATGRIARAALALNHAITNPIVPIASGAYSGYEAITAKTQDPLDNFVGIASSGAGLGLTFADMALGGTKAIPIMGNFASGFTLLWDGFGAFRTYQACIARPD